MIGKRQQRGVNALQEKPFLFVRRQRDEFLQVEEVKHDQHVDPLSAHEMP